MKWETKYKIIHFSCISAVVILFLFLIIFNGAFWGIHTPKTQEDTLSIVISVLIPFLLAIICCLFSYIFKTYTKQDAIRNADKMREQNKISEAKYVELRKEIEIHELLETKLKAEVEIERKKIEEQMKREAIKISNQLKKEAKKISEESESDK